MNDEQLLRYSRHIFLDEVGIEGQEAILAAHAVVIGAGGLGSPAAMYLASAGVGRITLVDDDTVDLTNLQRQIAHTTERVGQAKVSSCAASLQAINPHVQIHTVQQRVDAKRLQTLVGDASVVLDCTDNYRTRQAINAACVALAKPLVSGAAIRFDGQISVFDRRHKGAACYACLFSPEEQFEEASCSTMGVFAPLVGIIGTMQAAEALKLIAGIGRSLDGRLMMLELKDMEWSTMRVSRNPQCPVCGEQHL
ncbi:MULTISPECIES: HesA/MoeB/ThiF family protein [Comamonas]|jgi:molybdopterin/thiamine biosynthesis adenylyltransferase|uniref:HesA/MoeB/ThiF family protein n=1 Tax=Comamonas squillarum TaxID=2977320 RepID=A0ABY5ZW53_9BURK|nr:MULTISPECIES: HesA/MoeB/ThiF family protein [Comamonas]PWB20308.1 molybdopterin biosynthesis protein MoeB [Comamonas sp. JNW]UXC18217.1 HesA/MoeB/ThiF family protein [Comamonas sp. PR12]